jgi:hypothetical protein
MPESELSVLENAIVAHLEAVFGPWTDADALPGLVNQSISWIVCELAPALSPETLQNVRAAVAYLYPPDPHYSLEELSTDAALLSWQEVAALLRLWALLISDDTRVSIQTITNGDFSPMDAFLAAKGFDTPVDDLRKWHFIFKTVILLRQAHDDVLRSQVAESALRLSHREIIAISAQCKNPKPDGPYYDLSVNRLLLAIDPNRDLESILASVRQIVQTYHDEMSGNHAANWNDEERRIFGEAHIEGTDPVKGFTYKGRGDKGRTFQTFTGEAAEALLVFALRRNMAPVEINERFFPSWPDDTDTATRPKAKRNVDRYNLAKRLISNAQSGVSMQT